MQQFEPPREQHPFFERKSTGDAFEVALREAVRENARTMAQLHATVTACVHSLRAEGMQCEAAMLTMKAFVKDLARRQSAAGLPQIRYAEFMLDQVVRWCISDFYTPE
jgi:hypothetical protein